MKRKQTKTLKSKMLLSMLVVVLLQSMITIAVFTISHTAEQLTANSVQVFTNSTTNKTDEMKQLMLKWSNINTYQQALEELILQVENQNEASAYELFQEPQIRRKFLKKTTDAVLENLRASEVSGSFILLENESSSNKDAVYLRDTNPMDTPNSNKDILMLAGPSSLMYQYDFTLDSIWTSQLPISEDNPFFYKTIDAGNTYQEIDSANLGYWSMPYRLKNDDQEYITYCRPLLDRDHRCIGIFGISISLEYLNKYLSLNAIGIDSAITYYLGVTTDNVNFQTVSVNRNYYKYKLTSGSTLTISKKPDSHELFQVTTEGYNGSNVFFWNPIKLYNTNTPFETEQWVLGGLSPTNILYSSANRFHLGLILSLFISFTLSVTWSFLLTSSMVKPLHRLSKNIAAIKSYSVTIPKTNIREVDELVEKIETLGDKVYKAGSRVADILETSGLSLGLCEIEPENPQLFCTGRFLELTQLKLDTWKKNYADAEEFNQKYPSFQQRLTPVEDETDIYRYQHGNEPTKWFHIWNIPSDKSQLVLIMDVTHEIAEKLKIKHERDYDVLTDLYNRRAFNRMAQELLNQPSTSTGVISVWDLDNLKFVNDTYGHDMGDQYICLMAEAMKERSKPSMISARMSGDEFMVFLYEEDTEDMFRHLESLHQCFEYKKLVLSDGSLLPVSVSAGMVSIEEGRDLHQLTQYADFSMYEIKKNAKGGIRRFNRESYIKNYILIQGVGELSHILSEGIIRYAFQPIVDIRKKNIYAYEALMRPVSDMLGNPADFLRVAKDQSKLNQVETITWFQALKQFRSFLPESSDCRLFVNSIPNQLLSQENWTLLEEMHGDILQRVVLELTEDLQLNDTKEQVKKSFCKKWNMMRALDDYGSGFSNTDRLVSDDFDFVKLDMGLVRNIHLYPERKQLVGGMIQYCHSKKIQVIAEGVETKEELVEIIALGADYIQGFYFSKPSFEAVEIPPERFEPIQ